MESCINGGPGSLDGKGQILVAPAVMRQNSLTTCCQSVCRLWSHYYPIVATTRLVCSRCLVVIFCVTSTGC